MAKQPFENQPSALDELSHLELRLMHEGASNSILFAKNIQWLSVGISLLIFVAIVAISQFSLAYESIKGLLAMATILLTCGTVFMLFMYQLWQFNEIGRIIEIEKHFSTLYKKIRNVISRRQGNVERYTILAFMIFVVIAGAVIANIGIRT